MKYTIINYVLAVASLLQVGANPLRVVVVSESQGAGSSLRFGHPAAAHETSAAPVAQIVHPTPGNVRKGCGARFREKSLAISNAFREALGLPPIPSDLKPELGPVDIFLPFIGVPPTFVEGVDGMTKGGEHVIVVPPHHGHHRAFRHRIAHESFLTRVHIALMTLGPWEGRAVAFVLGCGLGVLLRMLWVLAVISFRAIRGDKEEHEYQQVLFDEYDTAVVAPPQYVVDEKAEEISTAVAK